MGQIPLTKGKFVVVDDEDVKYLSQWRWYYSKSGYAVRTRWKARPKAVWMHRLLTHCPVYMQVDHINGNKLDNRKDNLRIVTEAENHFNIGLRSDNKSGVKGVNWRPDRNKWRARINVRGKEYCLGHFISKDEAISVYKAAEVRYYGEYRRKEGL